MTMFQPREEELFILKEKIFMLPSITIFGIAFFFMREESACRNHFKIALFKKIAHCSNLGTRWGYNFLSAQISGW